MHRVLSVCVLENVRLTCRFNHFVSLAEEPITVRIINLGRQPCKLKSIVSKSYENLDRYFVPKRREKHFDTIKRRAQYFTIYLLQNNMRNKKVIVSSHTIKRASREILLLTNDIEKSFLKTVDTRRSTTSTLAKTATTIQ